MKSFFKTMFATMLGMLLLCPLIWVFLLVIVAAFVSSNETPVSISDNSVLKLELRQVVAERSSENPFDEYASQFFAQPEIIGLNTIKKVIRSAQEDEKIKAIVLDVSQMSASFAIAEEIRNLLVDFAKEKPIYCYGDYFMQREYYLVSAATGKYMNPQGMLDLHGLSARIIFIKKLLDKLDIDMQVIRHGTFKSSVEPFVLDKMSEANKLQTKTFVYSMWNHIVGQISQSTGVSSKMINQFCDSLLVLQTPEYAFKNGLLDGLVYRDEFDSLLKANLELPADKDIRYVTAREYKRSMRHVNNEHHRDKIAIIYAIGEIRETANNIYSQDIIGQNIADELAKVRKDDNVKAVVLRVNSPGGSALLSEVIWREVYLTQQQKPVVVSMGAFAASGGYYISCAANYIVSQPTTLTGSIGVFGLIPNIGKLMENKLGLTVDGVNTNLYADMGNISRPLTSYENYALQQMVDQVYGVFTKRVADGRKMTLAAVDSIGQGRIWSGVDAVKIGLVDTLGGMDVAIAKAAELAGISHYNTEEYPALKGWWETLLRASAWQSKLLQNIQKQTLGNTYFYLNSLESALQLEGIQAKMPYFIEIQ